MRRILFLAGVAGAALLAIAAATIAGRDQSTTTPTGAPRVLDPRLELQMVAS